MQHLQKLGMKLKETMLYWARCVDNNPRAATHYGKWVLIKGNNAQTVGLMHWEFIPTYTLQDLLDKLPDGIDMEDYVYWLYIDMSIDKIYYERYDCKCLKAVRANNGKSLLDAAYELLVWCIEQGHVKTEGGDNV